MSLDRIYYSLSALAIILSSILFSGCITHSQTQLPQTPLSMTIPPATLTDQPSVSVLPTTTEPELPTISPVPSSEPIFPETNSTTDANGMPILSKSQVWSYAESYLQKRGLINIQSGEVKAYEPHIFIDKDKKQELIWTFEIHRRDSMGFERGGIIFIEAHDGHVVSYAAFV